MQLTHEKFMKTVPQETAKFVKFILPYLSHYQGDKNLRFNKNIDYVAYREITKIVYLIFYALCENKEYESFLAQHGFQQSTIKVSSKVSDEKELSKIFAENSYIFNILDDEIEYERLSPLDILIKNINEYYNTVSTSNIDSLFCEIFTKCRGIYEFRSNLMIYKQTEKNIQDQLLEEEIFSNLPISVVSYLETASKIRKIILKNLSGSTHNFIKNIDVDIVPLSLFLALYQYKDTQISHKLNTSEQRLIKSFLESNNIQQYKVCRQLSIDIDESDIRNTERSLITIKNLFTPYFETGTCENINKGDITVSKIAENVFNREFTKSYVIEKLLAELDRDISIFDSFEEKIFMMLKNEEKNQALTYVKDFYSGLDKDTKDFIDFTSKTYILLLEKMKSNKHNKELLSTEDDADSLALLIASYYFGGDVSNFFLDYKVTLEKILKLLNIEITQEEIEKVELNEKVLVEKFKRFVYDGINRNKRDIQMNDIVNNLCNRDFNKSFIIESVFEGITDDIDLSSDFYNQLQKHIQNKEQQRINSISQKLFSNIPVETINYLENVSRIHNSIKQKTDKLTKNDIKVFSLLLGVLYTSGSEAKEFFESQGFDSSKIIKYIDISNIFYDLSSRPVDVDLLTHEYSKYIFGGHNRDKERKDLTVLNISKNIFNKQLNNSVNISRFLATFNHSYEKFEDFDKLYKDYLITKKQKTIQAEGKRIIDSFNRSTKLYTNNVLKVHKGISKELLEQNGNKELLSNEEDIAIISMIIALYVEDNDIVKFFEKNNITLDKILDICNLKNINVSKLLNNGIDYSLFFNTYRKYFDNYSFDNIIKNLFKSENEVFMKNLCVQVNVDYRRLKTEIETGKNYEQTLTIDDRIALLEKENITELNPNDISSILHFGDSLVNHSVYIHDELPKLALSDAHDSSVATINSIINKMYEKEKPEPKKVGFFAKFFSVEIDEEKPKLVLNPTAIKELNPAIDSNITVLSQELLAYDAIRKYMEVYEKKNRSYHLVALEISKEIQEKLSSLNPENPDEYSEFLSTNSKLQIINAKVERFATTSQLLKQELFKVNQAIVNHFITINALEMAKTDLLPLIGSELAIAKGRDSENQAMDLSHNVIQLFQAIISRNVSSTIDNIEQLKKSNIPAEIFDLLNKDVNRYLEDLNNFETTSQKLEMQNKTEEDEYSNIDMDKKLNKTIC